MRNADRASPIAGRGAIPPLRFPLSFPSPFLLLLLLLFLFLPPFARADDTATVVPNTLLDPFGYTGRVSNGWGHGSGTVVGSPHVLTTAAHVAYDDRFSRWWSELTWKWRNVGDEIRVRSFRYIGSYADLAATHGDNDARTFAQDFALGLSYTPLAGDGRFAPVDANAATSLRGRNSKQIIGFPSGLYGVGSSEREKMHTTGTFSRRFVQSSGEYHTIEGVSLGPGASGGGVWVRSSNVWRWAGLHVSGQVTSLGASVNRAGVVAHAGNKQQLLAEVIAAAVPGPPRILSAPAFFEVNYGESASVSVQIETGLLETTALWYRRDGDQEERQWSGENVVYGPVVSYSLKPHRPDVFLRVELRNAAGTVSTPWIEARVLGLRAPRILAQPTGLELGSGESGVLEVEYEGTPAPTFIWETLEDSGEIKNMGSSGSCYQSRGNRLELGADCLGADGALVRLRLLNVVGEAQSDWMSISVAKEPLTAAYGPRPAMLEWKETAEVRVVSPRATKVLWERRAAGTSSWLMVPWSMTRRDGVESRLSLRNDALNALPLHGLEFRAIAQRSFQSLRYGWVVEEVTLDPFALVADAPPVVTRQVLGGEWNLSYHSLRPPTVEWQAWDESARAWRPLTESEMAIREESGRVAMVPRVNTRSLQVRALVRHPLSDKPREHRFPAKHEAALADDALARCPLPFAGEHSGISASGHRVVLRETVTEGDSRLWTFELDGRTLRQVGRPLRVEPGLNASMPFWALRDDSLVVVNRHAYAQGGGLARGCLEVHQWDEEADDWSLHQTIRVPDSGLAEALVDYVSVEGDWMHVTAGRSHLYRRGADGLWEWVQDFARPASVPEAQWMEAFRYFNFLGDELLIGSRTALGAYEYGLYRYRWNPASARYEFLEHRLSDELYFATHAGRLVGNGVDGFFRYLTTATWTDAAGFVKGERFNHFAAWYGFSSASPYLAIGKDFSAPGVNAWFFRLEEDGTISSHHTLAVHRFGGPFTALQPFAGASDHGFFAVANDADGHPWLFAMPWEAIWEPGPPRFTPWLATVRDPATGRAGVEFRQSDQAFRVPRLLSSENLRDWAEVTDEAVVVDPDADGDGLTRRLRFEPPGDAPMRFYRLVEEAAPPP
jgi:hypothetical protein